MPSSASATPRSGRCCSPFGMAKKKACSDRPIGSRSRPFRLDHVVLVINADMVGRARGGKLEIFGSRTTAGHAPTVQQRERRPEPDDRFPLGDQNQQRSLHVLQAADSGHADPHRPARRLSPAQRRRRKNQQRRHPANRAACCSTSSTRRPTPHRWPAFARVPQTETPAAQREAERGLGLPAEPAWASAGIPTRRPARA